MAGKGDIPFARIPKNYPKKVNPKMALLVNFDHWLFLLYVYQESTRCTGAPGVTIPVVLVHRLQNVLLHIRASGSGGNIPFRPDKLLNDSPDRPLEKFKNLHRPLVYNVDVQGARQDCNLSSHELHFVSCLRKQAGKVDGKCVRDVRSCVPKACHNVIATDCACSPRTGSESFGRAIVQCEKWQVTGTTPSCM